MKQVTANKKASHNYFILDRYEAGIVLTGTEIKSIRQGKININDSYARIKDLECFLVNTHISKYQYGTIYNHDETRERKLLLNKHEIMKLYSKLQTEDLTLIPIRVYFNEGLCKVEIALCKGKKLHDKREDSKEKDQELRTQKSLKHYY